jgi:hypothetical protein
MILEDSHWFGWILRLNWSDKNSEQDNFVLDVNAVPYCLKRLSKEQPNMKFTNKEQLKDIIARDDQAH